MRSVFLSILGISVSVGLIILALLALAPFLNKRYAAKWKYFIWIFLAFRLLIPFSGVNGRLVMGESGTQNQTESGQREKQKDNAPDVTTPYRRIVVEIPEQMTAPMKAKTEHGNSGIAMLDIVAFGWIGCSLIFISVHIISYLYYKRRLIKKGRRIEDAHILIQMAKLKRELQIRRITPVIESCETASPMIIGFLKPVVVLPKEQYGPQELFFILKHELVHLKRGDVYFKLLFVMANAVHWFNPLIWIMRKEATLDLELSCDERVTQDTSYAARKAYTETLLSMLHKRSGRREALTTQFYGGKEIMKKRFKNILRKNGKKNGSFLLISAVSVTIGFGTLVGCSTSKEDTGNGNLGNEDMQYVSGQPNGGAVQKEQAPKESFADENSVLEHTITLTFSKEGEQEQKQAALAVGEGYSIYLPEGEWRQSGLDTWTAAVNEQVRLWVTHFKDSQIDSVIQKLAADGYAAEEGSHMWKQEGELAYHIQLNALENDVWGISYSYPAEFEEGFGRELPVIAGTFAPSIETDGIKSKSPDEESEYLMAQDCQEIRTIVDEFAVAYFDGNIDAMQKFLANTYAGKIDGYEGAGAVSDFTVKGLSEADGKKIENGKYVVSLEFRDSNYEDMFQYLTLGFIKQENNWKIEFYGVEG